MTIEITKEQADILLKLDGSYFFGLYKEIVKSDDEEMLFRNVIAEIAEEVTTALENNRSDEE